MTDGEKVAWIAAASASVVGLIGFIGVRTGLMVNRRTSIEQMALARLEAVEKQKAALEARLETREALIDTLQATVEELRRLAAVGQLADDNQHLREEVAELKRQQLIGGVEESPPHRDAERYQ